MAKKEKKAAEGQIEAVDSNHAETRVYELGFHLDPELSESEVKKAYDGIRGMVSVVAEGAPQKIQLAYTVSRTEQSVRQDFNSSYFAWIAYEADGATHEKVLETMKGDRRVFRFIDVRTTKEQALHAAEMHEIMLKAPQKEEEEVADAELDAVLKEVA